MRHAWPVLALLAFAAAAHAQAPKITTLVIRSDAACELFVDGQRTVTLAAGQTTTIQAAAGDTFVDCVSTEDPAVRHSSVYRTIAGDKHALSLALESRLGALRARQRADAADVRRQAGFSPEADGAVTDTRSGLQWTAQDNGDDITWAAATAWCAQRGRGWRLPTAAELEALVDRSGEIVTRCGSGRCKVSSRLRLSEAFFWAGERAGGDSAWVVGLASGTRDAQPASRADPHRALCVRRP